MPPKRKQPSRVTRSGAAGTSNPLKVKRRCQSVGSTRQHAATSTTIPVVDKLALPKLAPGVKLIEFIAEFDVGEPCCTVQHHNSEQQELLLVGCANGLKIINRQQGNMYYVGSYQGVEVAAHNGEIFVSTRNQDKTGDVFKHSYNALHSVKLFSYIKNTDHVVYNMSVSDEYIACIDHDNSTIILYNRAKQTKKSMNLHQSFSLRSVCFTRDKSLLVTYFHRDDRITKLTKYNICEQDELSLLWTCEDVPGADGVAVDHDGLIFVSDTGDSNIHVLSDKGEKLYEIRHEKLPTWCRNVSIQGNEMVVCGRGKSNIIRLFKIL